MSLFQVRDWWSCRGNVGAHAMVICNIDNEPVLGNSGNPPNKIVLGGLDGILRM
jgi:hypothetical protein